jgi:hypothetical protein
MDPIGFSVGEPESITEPTDLNRPQEEGRRCTAIDPDLAAVTLPDHDDRHPDRLPGNLPIGPHRKPVDLWRQCIAREKQLDAGECSTVDGADCAR